MTHFVKVSFEDKLAIVTVDNPPLNVLSKQVFLELSEIFKELEKNADVIAVIVTSSGNRAFVAGADIKEFPQMMENPTMKKESGATDSSFSAIAKFPKPTIAALNGLTFGGGCELALACDIRIAEEQIQIGLSEVKLGLFPGGGGTQRLPRLIGDAKAKELMFTGDPISAVDAERVGLVNRVVSKGEALTEAKKFAKNITRHSLQALSRIKKSVDDGLDRTLADGIALEAQLFVEVFQTEDIKEGVKAFIEKRKPVFQHR